MEGFDLGRLNPIAFERLIRALCFAKMGPGGTVYSAGPDGGRDFTYDGAIAGYEGRRWRGYLVIQAKFKDPSVSRMDDIAWLKAQLDAEFSKYVESGTRLKRPEYYILVTNIRLSGSDGISQKKSAKPRKGGMTKVEELFQPWKDQLKLKDFDIWAHDKIVDLLAAQPEIRQTYAQFITPGDVLSKTLQHFSSIRPDFGEVASRSLKNSLQRDQYVRLKDAGSVSDLQIRTSQVVVDLPLSQIFGPTHGTIFDPEDDLDEDDLDENERVPFNAIAQLVDRAREKLDAETLLADEDRSGPNERHVARNRIVLMGGPWPGQVDNQLIPRSNISGSDTKKSAEHPS
jgi:hypothetical protein